MRRLAILTLAVLALSACGRKAKVSLPPALAPTATSAPEPTAPEPPAPKPDAPAVTAAPRRAVPPHHELEGLASFYAEPYHARRTANGEMFDTYKDMTAAHRTLPFNTMIRVTNKVNSESVDVRINDRGPFVQGRVIDLSVAAAEKIDMVRAGVVPVKITILEKGDGRRVRAEPVKSGDSPPVHPLYTVQIGALTSQQSAENLKARLVSKFSDVSIVAVPVNDTTIYRVRVGNGINLITARKLASQLRLAKLNPAIIRLD